MQYALNEKNERVQATPAVKAICECCKSEVLAKCGTINIWHFAHKNIEDCDSWYEPESEWHRNWKGLFPEENQEVVIGKHRADLKIKDLVIELQNSPINVDTVIDKELFYKNMIWIVNAEKFKNNFLIYKKENYHSFKWLHPRKSWKYADHPICLDLGDNNMFLIKKMHDNFLGWGKKIKTTDLIKELAFKLYT